MLRQSSWQREYFKGDIDVIKMWNMFDYAVKVREM
jgi:hypothetical protein